MQHEPHSRTNRSFIFSNVKQVYPLISTGYQPKADNNVSQVTEQCLYARSLSGKDYNGRGNAAWLIIAISVITMYAYTYSIYIVYTDPQSTENITKILLSAIIALSIFLAASSWVFYYWRIELPICFNRTTRLVSIWYKNRLIQINWDEIEAHVKLFSSINAAGFPYNDSRLYFNIYIEENRYEVGVPGTDHNGVNEIDGAYMIWEYIRVFMKDGVNKLPSPDSTELKHEIISWKQAFTDFNPFPIIKTDSTTIGWKIFNLFMFPLNFAFMFIATPTDLIYMALDNSLPRKACPRILKCACEARSKAGQTHIKT